MANYFVKYTGSMLIEAENEQAAADKAAAIVQAANSENYGFEIKEIVEPQPEPEPETQPEPGE